MCAIVKAFNDVREVNVSRETTLTITALDRNEGFKERPLIGPSIRRDLSVSQCTFFQSGCTVIDLNKDMYK